MQVVERNRHIAWEHLFKLHEKKKSYMVHDQLFKQLIGNFFEEFLEAFFPDIHSHVKFEKITPLSEELFADMYDGDKKILDIVMEVRWKEIDSLIVVHVEPQSTVQSDFNRRMFRYYSLLYNKLNKPIIPIAVFSYDEPWNKNKFVEEIAGIKVLQFEYLSLHLKKKNWHEFIKKDNPVSAVLMSKMGYKEEEKVQVKLEFFKILTRLELNLEEKGFLIGFFEHYLSLNKEEEETFMNEAERLENADEILNLPISYMEKGKEIGREEGLERGLEQAREKTALAMLKDGFASQKIAELTELSIQRVEELKRLQ